MTEIRSLPPGAQKIVYASMARHVVDLLYEGTSANAHERERHPFADEVYCAWTETETIVKPALDGQFDREVRERIEVFHSEHDGILKLFAMADEALEPVRVHEEALLVGMRTPGIASFVAGGRALDHRAAYVRHVAGVFLKEKEIFGRLELCEPDVADSDDDDDDDDDDGDGDGDEESDEESEADEEDGAVGSDEESTSTSADEEAEACEAPSFKRRRDSDSENDSEDEARKA